MASGLPQRSKQGFVVSKSMIPVRQLMKKFLCQSIFVGDNQYEDSGEWHLLP